ncbi:hypothetical protein [Azospirillum brasilense]|uniref:hypothetical protein n=1 Tax=Azospirillum brasilense TaxID=192 RepID=UPI000E690971|nr:hypothetical protein [Azospirillum brasilense]NUB23333.1 hypothetical protein [Azospirillum brasilense]NUB30955.1 hypothetical protein [Azospirillum brasilense]RIW05662.1 hypothetical protein D2T81_07400 [Azospirillum brasilense]
MSIIDISKTDIEVIDAAYDGTSAFGIFMNGDRKGEWSAKIIGGEIRLEYNSTADGAIGNDPAMDAIGDDLVDTLYDDVCHLVRTEINRYRIFCMTMDLG